MPPATDFVPIIISVALALLGIGAQFGNGFTLNRGVVASWSAAVTVPAWFFLGWRVGVPVLVGGIVVIVCLYRIPYVAGFRYAF